MDIWEEIYLNEQTTIVKRMIAFRNHPPKNGGMPCGASRVFLCKQPMKIEIWKY